MSEHHPPDSAKPNPFKGVVAMNLLTREQMDWHEQLRTAAGISWPPEMEQLAACILSGEACVDAFLAKRERVLPKDADK